MDLIALLELAVGYAIVCYVIWWAMGRLKAPEVVVTIVTVLMVLVAVVWLLSNFLPATANLGFRHH
jgi:Co/Zn/Cd efflux system component